MGQWIPSLFSFLQPVIMLSMSICKLCSSLGYASISGKHFEGEKLYMKDEDMKKNSIT